MMMATFFLNKFNTNKNEKLYHEFDICYNNHTKIKTIKIIISIQLKKFSKERERESIGSQNCEVCL